jgi:hypothetical protein
MVEQVAPGSESPRVAPSFRGDARCRALLMASMPAEDHESNPISSVGVFLPGMTVSIKA